MPAGGFVTLREIIGDDSQLFFDSVTWDTALHVAATKGHVDIVSSLVSGGFPVDLQNGSGQSALHLATLALHLNVCKCLLAEGADPMLKDDSNTSPLDIAMRLNDFDLVDNLLRTKPPLHRPSPYLVSALRLDREEVIRAFLHNGFSLRISDPDLSSTLLHYMASISNEIDVRVFRRLLDEGIDVNARDQSGATALHVVARRCSKPEILQLLLDANADPNIVDSKFRGTPLLAATLGGKVSNVKILLDGGANPFWTFGSRRTILHVAAQDGIPDLVELFIKRGVDVNALDDQGRTAAYWAACNGHIDAIKVMLNHGLDLGKEQGQTTKTALREGNTELVQLLLDHGVSLHFFRYVPFASMSENGRNMPLLLLFCRNVSFVDAEQGNDEDERGGVPGQGEASVNCEGVNAESQEHQIEYDIDDRLEEEAVNSTEEDIRNPPNALSRPANHLLRLMLLRYHETVAAAIECGADVSSLPKAALGSLCLVCARYNLVQGMKSLVAAGAPTTSTAKPFGWTAVHLAAWKGHLEIIRIVRARGWDMCAIDDQENSAMHIAALEGHMDIVEELLGEVSVNQSNLDRNTALHFAAGKGGSHIVSRLIKAGAIRVVNQTNAGGMIPLHFACQDNRLDVTKVLVGAGSNLIKGDAKGASSLHYAARYGSTEVLKFLLGLDIDLDVRTADGSTALHLAAEHGVFSAVKPLLDAGANPNLVNNHGKSPLEVAVANKNLEIVESLISRSQARWQAPRNTHILFQAFQSKDQKIAAFVLSTMESELGPKKARRVVGKMYPELVAGLLVDPESTVSVCSLLVPFLQILPKNSDVQYMIAHHLLMSCIKHTDNTKLVMSLLKIHPVLAKQVTLWSWTPLHSACKHGRSATVKILLQHGAKADTEALASKQTPLDLARKYSPDSGIAKMIERFEAVRRAVKQHQQSRVAWSNLRASPQNPDSPH